MRSGKRVRAAPAGRRSGPTKAEIVDRVLDRGLVINNHSRVSLGGIDTLVRMDGQSIVTSTEANLAYAAPVRKPAPVVNARPLFDGPADPFVDAPVAEKGRARRSVPERKRKRKR